MKQIMPNNNAPKCLQLEARDIVLVVLLFLLSGKLLPTVMAKTLLTFVCLIAGVSFALAQEGK